VNYVPVINCLMLVLVKLLRGIRILKGQSVIFFVCKGIFISQSVALSTCTVFSIQRSNSPLILKAWAPKGQSSKICFDLGKIHSERCFFKYFLEWSFYKCICLGLSGQ
jgi:hypothetical protein